MSKDTITKKQREILDYIKEQIVDRGFPPSVREICNAVNLKSTSSVHTHLSVLEKNGYIHRDPAKPRCIEIADDSFNSFRKNNLNVPILGQVTAGLPILAVENIEGYFPVPSDMLPSDAEPFMLRVRGESMINAGIYDKDLILVKRQTTAENGDKVVAMVGDMVTVKTFYKEKDHFRLQPENDIFSPIIVDVCQILGKVIGLFRML
jgi:repressor LexA